MSFTTIVRPRTRPASTTSASSGKALSRPAQRRPILHLKTPQTAGPAASQER